MNKKWQRYQFRQKTTDNNQHLSHILIINIFSYNINSQNNISYNVGNNHTPGPDKTVPGVLVITNIADTQAEEDKKSR